MVPIANRDNSKLLTNSKQLNKKMQIWQITDESHRASQGLALISALCGLFTERNPQAANCSVMALTTAQCDYAGGVEQLLLASLAGGPEMVVGVGQAVRPYLVQVKRHLPHCFAVHILDPYKDYDALDLVVIPAHEPHTPRENIITTTALLTQVNSSMLVDVMEEVQAGAYPQLPLSALPMPRYALMLGGKHVGDDLTVQDVELLLDIIQPKIQQQQGSLLISTSPRTNPALVPAVQARLTVPHLLYDWRGERTMRNPYLAFLALADGVIVTGDSLRMLSEAASIQKSLWIYSPHDRPARYAALHTILYDGGYARPCTSQDFPQIFAPPVLNEARRVAEILLERFTTKKR